jgi:hypothetical protein
MSFGTLARQKSLAGPRTRAEQYLARRSDTELSPAKRLMLAVLENAVTHYQGNAYVKHATARLLFLEAAAWFASDDTSHLYTARNVCEALGLDLEYLRRGLRAWSDRGAGAKRARFTRHAGHMAKVLTLREPA